MQASTPAPPEQPCPSLANNSDFSTDSVAVTGQAGTTNPFAGVDMEQLRQNAELDQSLSGGGQGGPGGGRGQGGGPGGPGGGGPAAEAVVLAVVEVDSAAEVGGVAAAEVVAVGAA